MPSRTSLTRTVIRIVAPLAVAALVVTAAPAAQAEARNLGEEADYVMNLHYRDFIDYKYNRHHPYPFNFSDDGCSLTPSGIREQFNEACQQHDFGYRNYGNGLRIRRDEGTRRWIDDRFHAEMDRICDDRFRGFAQQGNNQVCKYQSDVVYNAVRQFGSGAFFGG